eukprot:8069616-Alexandrium_andersonii.AAC.1
MSGIAQKSMDEGPHTPRAPAERPANVSKEPRGMPPRARRSPSAPLWTMSQTFPARRRYGASP